MRKQLHSVTDRAIKTVCQKMVSYLRTLQILDDVRWDMQFDGQYISKKRVLSIFECIEEFYTTRIIDEYAKDMKKYRKMDIASCTKISKL